MATREEEVERAMEQKQRKANGHRGAETTKASSRIIVANGSQPILIFSGLDLARCFEVWKIDDLIV